MGQCADNFRFDITAWAGHYNNGRDILLECLQLAFAEHDGATHWAVASQRRLILFWTKPDVRFAASAFITRSSPNALVPTVRGWLSLAPYPKEPDHDGSNSKGWRIYNEAWGNVDNESYAICAIEPAWLMHGK